MAFPAIWTRYLGPTDHTGSRVKATTVDKRSTTVSWDDSLTPLENHTRAALQLTKRLGWTGTMVSGDNGNSGYIFVFTRRTYEFGGFGDAEATEVTK